jgi:murein hydrolase activator
MHLARFFLLSVFISIASLVLAAENAEQAQEDLDAINSAISDISNWLQEASSRQSSAEQQLEAAALEVTQVTQAMTSLENTIAEKQNELIDLQTRQSSITEEISEQQTLLQQAIRVAYITNDQSFLKMLLNQEDFSESSRMLYYSRVFSEAQTAKIENYQASLIELAEVNDNLSMTLAGLNEEQTQLQLQSAELINAQENRATALVRVNAEIAERNSELENLEVSQAEISALIEEIRRAMEGVTSFADVPPFENSRGELPPPTSGQITSRFGSSYGDGNLIRQGIMFGAELGTPIQAVHAGRIVFSDWLRGSGLLVIVDHGEGYMSLYGSNQSLAKQAGEWVDVGDVIATSGNGGATNRPGLYFEIRHRGEAQNPASWLR